MKGSTGVRGSCGTKTKLCGCPQVLCFNCDRLIGMSLSTAANAVRCASVIQLPSPALPSSRQSSTFEVLSHSAELDPSHTMAGHSFTISSTRLPTTRPFPTFQPTMTDNTVGGDGMTDRPETGPFTDTSATTPQPPLVQVTIHVPDIILYVILGLLGFLVVLVFYLSIVISILCWKKHRGIHDVHNRRCIVTITERGSVYALF